MREIIPESAIALLPFTSQSYADWEGENDLDVLYFLLELYDKTDEVILPDGTLAEMNYKNYALEVFAQTTNNVAAEAEAFTVAANYYSPAFGSAAQNIVVPNFLKDVRYGRVAKYLIAWEGVQREILSESAFFSLAHLREADTDIQCSIRLASSLFYKQALQVLRSYVENIILPLYLCADVHAFTRWQKNRFRVPPMRGQDGILTFLVDKYILSEELADKAADLYGNLNEAVHGAERNMIHSGTPRGEWSGQIFDDGKFAQWCDCLCRAIDLGIHLTKINLLQWALAKPKGKLDCLICHNDNSFTNLGIVEDHRVPLQHYRCRECGNEFKVRMENPDSREIIHVRAEGEEFVILRPE